MRAEPKISFIGTPIGNLGDLSQRAIDTIVKSDVVFAEDTRTATNLLNYLGIKKKIVSCHKDNEKKAAEKIPVVHPLPVFWNSMKHVNSLTCSGIL